MKDVVQYNYVDSIASIGRLACLAAALCRA